MLAPMLHRLRRYGLLSTLCGGRNDFTKLPASVPLRHELESYSRHLGTDVQLDRPSQAGRISSNTLADHMDVISKFTGYCYLYRKQDLSVMSLNLFSNQW
jgi:hypothetical protein